MNDVFLYIQHHARSIVGGLLTVVPGGYALWKRAVKRKILENQRHIQASAAMQQIADMHGNHLPHIELYTRQMSEKADKQIELLQEMSTNIAVLKDRSR